MLHTDTTKEELLTYKFNSLYVLKTYGGTMTRKEKQATFDAIRAINLELRKLRKDKHER